MISSVYFPKKDKAGNAIREGNLPAILKHNGRFEFKEGLNVILGANGTGKTSILNAIGTYMAAGELGYSTISHNWLMANRGFSNEFSFAAEVEHDGQSIFYGDPRRKKGYTNSGRGIEEFMTEGLIEGFSSNSESSGEQSLRRITPFLDILDAEPEFREITAYSQEMYAYLSRESDLVSQLHELYSPKIPKGQPTILLDEPESGLGTLSRILFWNKIKKVAEKNKFQIILVSHSTESLNIEGANYIELTEGYHQACLDALNGEELTEDIKKKSFSVSESLSSYQNQILRRMFREGDIEFKSETENLEKLMDLKLIDRYSKKAPAKMKAEPESRIAKRSQRRKKDRGYGRLYFYHLTSKGKDYVRNVLTT